MTLSSFKKFSRFSLVVLFLGVYGSVFFLLGKTSISEDALNLLKIKGISTQKSLQAPIESPIPATDSQSVSITASYVKLCSNATYGFEISYPKDWFTTYNTDDQKCRYFAPYSFSVPLDTDIQFSPISLEIIEPDAWVPTVKYYQNANDFQNIISVQNLEFNGRLVQKIRASLTGRDEATRGFSRVSFLVQDSRNPIVVVYTQQDSQENVAVGEKIAEDIASSLKYF